MSSYKIQSGDNLASLATRFGTSVDALMKANPQIKNANVIRAGAQLNIPGKSDTFEKGSAGQKPAPSGAGTQQAASANLNTSKLPAQYKQWMPDVQAAAKKYNLDPALILGVMSRESNGQNIRGDGGHGRGLMQIDDRSFGPWLASHNGGMDPASNIMQGAAILRQNIDAFHGDVRKGLAAYNAGAGNVQKAVSRGLDPDAYTTGHNYGKDVLSRTANFRAELGNTTGTGTPGPVTHPGGGTPGPVTHPRPTGFGTGVPASDLKKGDHGPQVQELQRDLVKLGFMSQADMNTGPGTFGQHTQAALQSFQSKWNLPSTGFFGPMSREAMTKALAGAKPPTVSTPPPGNGKYPTWNQGDPRWAGMRLIDGGPGQNIGPYGCAMTSTAMLLAGSGRTINGQKIDSPVVLNRYLQQHQSPGNGDLLEWQTAAHSVGFNAHSVSGGTLDNFLHQGHPVVMNVHNGGHWVLVTGHDSKGYICNDPATGTSRHLSPNEMHPWNGWAMY